MVFLAGCRTVRQPSPPLPQTPTSLAPTANPGERAVLRLGSPPGPKRAPIPAVEIPVLIRHSTHGAETTLTLLAQGETIERETYESRPDAFRVVAAGDDAFAPPLDLVRYPPKDGESWSWEGKVVYAGIARHAKAHITLKQEGTDLRSDVALTIDNAEGRPARERSFAFGFRPGKGVVWRTFGDVSARKPEGDPWPP